MGESKGIALVIVENIGIMRIPSIIQKDEGHIFRCVTFRQLTSHYIGKDRETNFTDRTNVYIRGIKDVRLTLSLKKERDINNADRILGVHD